MMYTINTELDYNGYTGYYATNKQVMQFDAEYAYSITKALDALQKMVEDERRELNV